MTARVEVTNDIDACRALRRTVFIDEEGVSEADEFDTLDDAAVHLLARDGGLAVGTARLLVRGEIGRIGRVCVLASHRGNGLGAALIRESLAVLGAQPGVRLARLGAQLQALGFYERLGFVAHGPVYDDAGIAHRDMDRPL